MNVTSKITAAASKAVKSLKGKGKGKQKPAEEQTIVVPPATEVKPAVEPEAKKFSAIDPKYPGKTYGEQIMHQQAEFERAAREERKRDYANARKAAEGDANRMAVHDNVTRMLGSNLPPKSTTEENGMSKKETTKSNRYELFGHAITAICRWMGARGWKAAEAKAVLIEKKCAPADGTITVQVAAGRNKDEKRGEPAKLTGEQGKELEALRKAYLELVEADKTERAAKTKEAKAASKPAKGSKEGPKAEAKGDKKSPKAKPTSAKGEGKAKDHAEPGKNGKAPKAAKGKKAPKDAPAATETAADAAPAPEAPAEVV